MGKGDDPRGHHKVPKLLLKNFTSGKKKQLFAYDKSRNIVFKSNPADVAKQRDFNSFKVEGERFNFEPVLGDVDGLAGGIVKQIVRTESLEWLSVDQRGAISLFLAAQQIRGDETRDWVEDFTRQILDKWGDEGELYFGDELVQPPDDDEKAKVAYGMLGQAHEFAPHYYEKDWILLKAPPGSDFYIGDSPLVLRNTLNPGNGLRSTIGLAQPGIEIYLPVASRLTLGLLCPTIREAGILPFLVNQVNEIHSEHAIWLNSLQVVQARQYVYSATDDFTLARDINQSSVRNADVRGDSRGAS